MHRSLAGDWATLTPQGGLHLLMFVTGLLHVWLEKRFQKSAPVFYDIDNRIRVAVPI
jgi:hypothetical protein